MKATFLFVSFFLAVLSTASLCVADRSPDPVRDIDGEELRTGMRYKIVPVLRGFGGGVTFRSIRNETCPYDVVQEGLEVNYGRALTFTPVDAKKGVIRLSTDLNIRFVDVFTICVQSLVWRLDNYDGEYVVSTSGAEGNPGPETISNWFKIEKLEPDYYKLVFCPTVCETCRPVCGDIGISIKDGIRRLVLSQGRPFMVEFKKV